MLTWWSLWTHNALGESPVVIHACLPCLSPQGAGENRRPAPRLASGCACAAVAARSRLLLCNETGSVGACGGVIA